MCYKDKIKHYNIIPMLNLLMKKSKNNTFIDDLYFFCLHELECRLRLELDDFQLNGNKYVREEQRRKEERGEESRSINLELQSQLLRTNRLMWNSIERIETNKEGM